MIKEKILVFIAALSLNVYAATPILIPLWPDGAPQKNGLEGQAETRVDDVIFSVSEPVLYIYPAENPDGTAVMMCPGGGYVALAMEHEGHDMAEWFNERGITYAVLKYRMPNGNRDVIHSDGEKAMTILRENAERWKIDPHRIGVMGASAGGHFASTLSTHYSSPLVRPDFQILFYPVISMQNEITHQGSKHELLGDNPSKELSDLYSNELRVDSLTPKAFIMLSTDDVVNPENSIRYYVALAQNGVSAALHCYPTGGHGWGFHDSFIYKDAWTMELEKWLKNEVTEKN